MSNPPNVTQHGSQSTVDPDHVTPECEGQMVPAELDPVEAYAADRTAELELRVVELVCQIVKRDERIATLTAMVEDGTRSMNRTTPCWHSPMA